MCKSVSCKYIDINIPISGVEGLGGNYNNTLLLKTQITSDTRAAHLYYKVIAVYEIRT